MWIHFILPFTNTPVSIQEQPVISAGNDLNFTSFKVDHIAPGLYVSYSPKKAPSAFCNALKIGVFLFLFALIRIYSTHYLVRKRDFWIIFDCEGKQINKFKKKIARAMITFHSGEIGHCPFLEHIAIFKLLFNNDFLMPHCAMLEPLAMIAMER